MNESVRTEGGVAKTKRGQVYRYSASSILYESVAMFCNHTNIWRQKKYGSE